MNSLIPGINGPTSLAAVRNADHDLGQIVAYVQSNPALANNTDIILTADHGFSTISKHEIDATWRNFVSDLRFDPHLLPVVDVESMSPIHRATLLLSSFTRVLGMNGTTMRLA